MRQHKLLYASSYDRGLQYLLFVWPNIVEEFPEAELHIAYGWQTFDKLTQGNPERKQWKEDMEKLMDQKGIIHHGRISKQELNKLNDECGILAYPSDFFEINCITVLNAQAHGCVPVVMNMKSLLDKEEIYSALDEVVKRGIKVEGNIRTPEGVKAYEEAIIGLMNDKTEWERLSRTGRNAVKSYSLGVIAEKWTSLFAKEISKPKVSIITPTIRRGFWNLMAENIANQSYKNLEWVVVDDFPGDRSGIMKRYCQNKGIEWKYVRGGKTDKFYYGLSTANNIGWKESDGELLVFLQDFVLMPTIGIESLVDIYRKHPNDLIAPTDVYHSPSVEITTESEDWFQGNTNVVGEFMRSNQRNTGQGIRYSEMSTDWEANYGAIPRSVVDRLGGWYEFFNDGLGFDNTEIAYRALLSGSKIIVDDTNRGICIDHWEALKNKPEEHGSDRERRLNDPRFKWMIDMIEAGKLPIKRDEKQDNFRLFYEMPKNISQEEAVDWVYENMDKILNKWKNII